MSTDSSPSAPPLIDLSRILVALRRRRRLWLSLGLAGLLAGAAMAFVLPSPPQAVTRLMIIHEQDAPTDGGTLMQTDVAVLQTTRIAAAALERLGSSEDPERFVRAYEGTGVTNNVLELTVEGRSGQDALARATALSEAFLADYLNRVRAGAEADAQALRDQRGRLQADLTQVDRRIATLTIEGSSAPELETLYARRAELSAQIADLSRRAEEAAIGAPRVAAGTQVVDPPRLVPRKLLVTGATSSLVGLLVGLAAGLGLVTVTSLLRDRPVLRREISEHLGASVIAQLATPPKGPSRLWRRSRRVTDRRRVAVTVARIARDDTSPLSLLDLGCPRMTAALAADLAGELATDGEITVINDLAGTELTMPEGPIRVVEPGTGPHTGRVIGVGSVAPGTAWTDVRALGAETVLVVRAGQAETAWLHTVARQLADLEIPVVGVVLVDPDPRDRSDGTLWEGLHTALRGRTRLADGAVFDAPTTRFAPVPAATNGNGNGAPSHDGDLPTRRFAPVARRSQD